MSPSECPPHIDDLTPQAGMPVPPGSFGDDRLNALTLERRRIEAEYARRAKQIGSDVYAPWQPAEMLMRVGRCRYATRLLRQAGCFPASGDQCLEVGYGALGWLGQLIEWGVRETDLHGIELDPIRSTRAQALLPAADLRVGDASDLPWQDGTFRLVVASMVFTSILDDVFRRTLAREITRVLAPGGALLWYDFARNNPRNPHVRGINRRELPQLFPELRGMTESVTLAPPLARLVAGRSWCLASVLEAIPLLRTHIIAVLVKTA